MTIQDQDQMMAQAALSIEKHVSSLYETALLESANLNLRQTIDHIQSEEEQHALRLFQYMQKQGWYTPS